MPRESLEPIDYLARWSKLIEARTDQGRRLDQQHARPDEWAGARAARFQAAVGRAAEDDPLLEHLSPRLRPTDTVLDVGAGPGRHVIPLARRVARVIAVEPSTAMRAQLREAIARERLSNVEIIEARWPVSTVDPADVVICSHVVYGVAEIERFVRALGTAARRHVAIVLRYGQREGPLLDLFARVWGERRGLAPTCVDLVGVLAQLGIYANLTVAPMGAGSGRATRFPSFEDAVAQVRADLLNPVSPEAEAIIRADLASRLVAIDGEFELPRPTGYAGILWWDEPSFSHQRNGG